MSSLVRMLIGAVLGSGIWMIGRGVSHRPLALETALAERRRSASHAESTEHLEQIAGIGGLASAEDLRILSRSKSEHALNKLLGALVGLAAPILVVLALASIGLVISPLWGIALSLVAAPLGFVFPDLRLKEQARERRKGFTFALAAYLDLVRILVAGGAHSDGALFQAAGAGEGWQFDELRAAIDWSRVNGVAPWVGFERLAAAINVAELSDLAGSISLADEQGASPVEALSRKAESLTVHQMAEARAQADSATEQMAVPTVLIAMAFVVFLGYPALISVAGLN